MPNASSSTDSKTKESDRSPWKDFVISVVVCTIFIALINAWSEYNDKYSTKSSVVAMVDDLYEDFGGGHGGTHWHLYIKATLPDGSKISATANPIGPTPPRTGQRIKLVKLVSVLGWTSYRWEPPLLTLKDDIGERAESRR